MDIFFLLITLKDVYLRDTSVLCSEFNKRVTGEDGFYNK